MLDVLKVYLCSSRLGMTGHLPPGPKGAWSAGRDGRLNEVLRLCGRLLKRREGGAKDFTWVQP